MTLVRECAGGPSAEPGPTARSRRTSTGTGSRRSAVDDLGIGPRSSPTLEAVEAAVAELDPEIAAAPVDKRRPDTVKFASCVRDRALARMLELRDGDVPGVAAVCGADRSRRRTSSARMFREAHAVVRRGRAPTAVVRRCAGALRRPRRSGWVARRRRRRCRRRGSSVAGGRHRARTRLGSRGSGRTQARS